MREKHLRLIGLLVVVNQVGGIMIYIITYQIESGNQEVGRVFLHMKDALAEGARLVEHALGKLIIDGPMTWLDEDGKKVRVITRTLEECL